MAQGPDDASDGHSLRRRRLIQLAGTASGIGLAGCAGDGGGNTRTATEQTTADEEVTTAAETTAETTSEAKAKRGGTLVVAQTKAPPDFDPVKGLGTASAIIGARFFSTLYTYDQDLQLVPGDLVTGMPDVEQEGARYVVELTDGAMFHNDTPVTAEDVKYSFAKPLETGSWVASGFNMIDTMTVIDDRTLQFDLEFTYGAFPSALSGMQIVPKEAHSEDPTAFGTENPIGSGPFEFASWTQGEITRLERWDDYWGDRKPYLDAVEFVPIPEPTTRVTEFKTTDTGLLQGIPPKLYSTAKEISDASVRETPALNYYFLTYNLKAGETTKLDVRNAISYAFDMNEVVDRYVKPIGVRQYQPVPNPTAKAWDMPIQRWKEMAHAKDIDKAKSLFEQADVPSDWTCTLLSPPDDQQENMCITVANGIKEAGYDAEVKRLEWGTYLETFTSGNPDDYNMYALWWSLGPNPGQQIYQMFHEQGAGANNGHYWSDPEVMDMIDRMRRSTSREERRELMIKVQTEVIKQKVQIPAWNKKQVWGAKDFVKDFHVYPLPAENPRLVTDYNNVWLDQ